MPDTGGVTAHEEKLLNLLWGPNLYEVPQYQRNFSWDVNEISELWNDLLRTATGSEAYFLGSMVFVKTDTSVVFEVLDGQQRFASLSLMLAAIRDVLKTKKPESLYIKNVQDTLTTMDLSGKFGHTETARLHLNERDQEYFEQIIKHGTLPEAKFPSHVLLRKAYEFFVGKFEMETAATDPEVLWASFVTAFSERLYVIRIQVGDAVDAQMVFEALNSAGLDLTQADLIKNYLLREVPVAQKETAYKSWTATADAVETDANLTGFIRTFWNSGFGFSRKDQLYKKIRDTVKRPPVSTGQVEVLAFIKQMEEEAEEWLALLSASVTGPALLVEDINRDLADLRTMGATLVHVPLLALRIIHKDDPASFAKCVRWFRDFYVRHTIVGRRAANEVEGPYAEWASRIRKGEMSVAQIYEEMKKLSPTDDEFVANFEALQIKVHRVGRLLLARINDSADPENAITQTYSSGGKVHLEHIIPQNPEKWQSQLDAEGLEHETVVNSIGNLTLLVGPKNQKISNLTFDVKQEEAYAAAKNVAPINELLAKCQSFGKQELSDRAEFLASQALKTWTLAP